LKILGIYKISYRDYSTICNQHNSTSYIFPLLGCKLRATVYPFHF